MEINSKFTFKISAKVSSQPNSPLGFPCYDTHEVPYARYDRNEKFGGICLHYRRGPRHISLSIIVKLCHKLETSKDRFALGGMNL